jgi:hypothetical protein
VINDSVHHRAKRQPSTEVKHETALTPGRAGDPKSHIEWCGGSPILGPETSLGRSLKARCATHRAAVTASPQRFLCLVNLAPARRRRLERMVHSIPILPASACGACEPSAAAGACRETSLPESTASHGVTHLHGPAAETARVFAALLEALKLRGVASPASLIHSLDLADGEAVLRMRAPDCMGGAGLLEVGFQCLRQALPDTDIYVWPVAPGREST